MPTNRTCNTFLFDRLFSDGMQLLPCVKWPPGVIRMLLFLLTSPFLSKHMYTSFFLATLLTYHTKNPKSLCYLFRQKLMQVFSAELLEEAPHEENRVHESEKHKYTDYCMHSFLDNLTGDKYSSSR